MLAITSIVAIFALAACESGWSQPAPMKDDADRRALPAPHRTGGLTLTAALATRRSSRSFGSRALDDTELGQLLWAAQGTSDGHRTAPSAGALYPLTIRVIDATGVWRYVPADHALIRELAGDHRGAVVAASFGQDAVHAAPTILVITAELAITATKYGPRAERFATLEAGHAAQNVLLEVTALGLAAVPVGAFDDTALRRALALPPADTPLYLIPVGAAP